MKKSIIVCILLLIFQGISTAQNPSIDSLQYQLKISAEDTSLVNILNQLAGYHTFQRPDSGVYYGSKALALARRLQFRNGEINALRVLGISHRAFSNYSKALQIFLEGLRLAEKYEKINYQGEFQFNVGSMYILLGDYENGLVYVRASINNPGKNRIYMSILAETWTAKAYYSMGELDSAFYYSYEAYKNAIQTNTPRLIMWSSRQLGELHYHLHNTDSAHYYFKLTILNADSDPSIRSNATLSLAKLFQQSGQYDSSVFYANTAMESAISGGVHNETIDACLFLKELHKESDPSKALEYLEIATIYRDSLDQLRQNMTFGDILDFDVQQRQYELENAKSEFQNRLRLNIFLGSTFTLLVIAFFLYRNNRQKQKANGLLKEQKEEVQSTLEKLESTQSQLIQSEKMASLGELTAGIAHEIQNPLNFVNNFSEVSGELVDEMQEEIDAGNLDDVKDISGDLKQNLEKINEHGQRASNIVKGMLEHSKTGDGVKELTDINKLADEYLRLAYHGLRAKDNSFNSDFKTDFDESLPKIEVIPQDIDRVLLNLINNAFYAVNKRAKSGIDGYKPIVAISTKKTDDSIEICVKDNGSGIPDEVKDKIFQPFFTTKPTDLGTGLGLSLSYDIIKAHGGKIKVESTEGEGSELIIHLPIKST